MRSKIFFIVLVVISLFITGSLNVIAEETKKEASLEEQTVEEITLIDINSATSEELQTLPGVGPKLAQVIIDGRPYEKIEDLLDVKGIGEKKLEKLKDLVEVKPLEEQKKEGETATEKQK